MSNHVRLCDPPYTTASTTEDDSIMKDLAKKMLLVLDPAPDIDDLQCALEYLKKCAIENETAKQRFEETKLSSFKIRLPKFLSEQIKEENIFRIECSLDISGFELKSLLCSRLNFFGTIKNILQPEKVRLICRGRLILDKKPLAAQDLRNNCNIMLILTEEKDSSDVDRTLSDKEAFERARRAAQIASNEAAKVDSDTMDLQLADQSGRRLSLPAAERVALTRALALHQHGRRHLREKRYHTALLILLEADMEFSTCGSELLKSVDNYALLCLDLVWCYFQLNSVGDLPNADVKLCECENAFNRSYGLGLERAMALKTNDCGFKTQLKCGEAALMVRLHLLQGVVAFYQNRVVEARQKISQAWQEANSLTTKDEQVAVLVEMGHTLSDARLALRVTANDLNEAANWLVIREQRRSADRRDEDLRHQHGRCDDGITWLSVDKLMQLEEMGFAQVIAAEALRQTNNWLERALQLLQDDQEQLQVAADRRSMKQLNERLNRAEANSTPSPHQSMNEDEEKRELLESVRQEDLDEHLDLDLAADVEQLQYFMTLLNIPLNMK